MTTVAEIISLALRDVGVLGEGQTASGDTMSDALTTLGQMLGLWQADKLYIYAQKEVVATLSGAASYTIGAGGNINASRPVKIDAAFWRSNGQDYEVEVFQSYEDYARLGNKLLAGGAAPCALCYVPDYPLGTVHVYPNGTSGALHLITRTDLPALSQLTDTLVIPPEYHAAIRFSLAEYLSTTFQTPLRPDIPALAGRARKIIKRNNVRVPLARMPAALGGSAFNIERD